MYDGQEFIPICIPPNLNGFLNKINKSYSKITQNYISFISEQCLEPLIIGSCRASINRYYFDLTEKTCKIFKYSGCNANKNNFESFHECSKQCGHLLSDNVPDEYDGEDEEYDLDDTKESDGKKKIFYNF